MPQAVISNGWICVGRIAGIGRIGRIGRIARIPASPHRAAYRKGYGFRFQISFAYCVMIRSLRRCKCVRVPNLAW